MRTELLGGEAQSTEGIASDSGWLNCDVFWSISKTDVQDESILLLYWGLVLSLVSKTELKYTT